MQGENRTRLPADPLAGLTVPLRSPFPTFGRIQLVDNGISKRHKLQFRFESFNFPNHPNWNKRNTNIAAGSSFGVITGTRLSMRQLQFALKYSF